MTKRRPNLCPAKFFLLLGVATSSIVAQTSALAPIARQQPLGNGGQILPGSCLYIYSAGTTTPQNTYNNSILTVANPNPIVLDAFGRSPAIYWNGTAIKMTLANKVSNACPGSPGTVVWSQDNITDSGLALKRALATASGAGLIGYQYPGAVPETVQSALVALGQTAENFCRSAGADKTTCLNAAVAVGGTVLLQPGTYTLQTATLTIPDNTHVVCAGTGSTIISGTGAFPAVTILNSQNSSLEGCSVQSAQDGILIKTADDTHPSIYNLLQNVTVLSYGDAFAGIHLNNTACCEYFPTFLNVNILSSAVGTRSAFLADGTDGWNVGLIWQGGRITNAKYGINAVSLDTAQISGVAIDGINAAAAAGIAVWLQRTVDDSQFNLRVEGVDKYCQFEAGTFANVIRLQGTDLTPAQCTDAGTVNSLQGNDGGAGLNNYNLMPETYGNRVIKSGSVFSMPGTTDGQFISGGVKATSAQLFGVGAVETHKAPHSNFGYPDAHQADSIGRNSYFYSADFDSATLGTFCGFSTPEGTGHPSLICASKGGSAGITMLGMGQTGTQHTPVTYANLIAAVPCGAGSIGFSYPISDASTTTFNAVLGGGSAGTYMIAFCDGTNYLAH